MFLFDVLDLERCGADLQIQTALLFFQVIDFVLQGFVVDNFLEGYVTAWPPTTHINLNDKWLSSPNLTKESLVAGNNQITFSPTKGKSFKGIGSIKIIYAEEIEQAT